MKKVKPTGKESEKGTSRYDWLCEDIRDFKRGLLDMDGLVTGIVSQFEAQRRMCIALMCRDCKEGYRPTPDGVHEKQILIIRKKNGQFKYNPEKHICPAWPIHQWR